jgi:N-acetylglutamate synthase-like GNAT family acetyltransferase/copper chaperone CopZ
MKCEPAQPGDLAAIRRLLEACRLPGEDIEPHLADFVVVKEGRQIVGVVGLEMAGEVALLRSLGVAGPYRGAVIGEALCLAALAHAARRGVKAVYLLTATAAGFFRGKLGFQDVERSAAPPGIRATREFTTLCDASAALLARNIAGAAFDYNAPMETIELKVEGMDCEGCVKSVTRMLAGVPGVEKVNVSLAEGKASVTYDPAKSDLAQFKRAVERAGYKAP